MKWTCRQCKRPQMSENLVCEDCGEVMVQEKKSAYVDLYELKPFVNMVLRKIGNHPQISEKEIQTVVLSIMQIEKEMITGDRSLKSLPSSVIRKMSRKLVRQSGEEEKIKYN
jgi:ABC-type proline/glycine betaine transport system ATPase subunit